MSNRDNTSYSRRSVLGTGVVIATNSITGCTLSSSNDSTEMDRSLVETNENNRLSDVFRASPSSRHAPADEMVSLDWVDNNEFALIKVTTLKNEGKGSLRWALNQTEPRIIIFEVGGVIDLQKQTLEIKKGHGDIIIAGQTAPSPGITLIRDALKIEARNVIVQHIRVRPGTDIVGPWDEWGHEGYSVSAIRLGEWEGYQANIIVDHCSVTWGSDETLSTLSGVRPDQPLEIAYPSEFESISISNNIIAEGLNDTYLHPQDGHSLGSLLFGGYKYRILGNLYKNVGARTPWIGRFGGAKGIIANNLLHWCYRGVMVDQLGPMQLSIVGNKFSPFLRDFDLGTLRTNEVFKEDEEVNEIYIDNNEYRELVGAEIWDIVDEPPVSVNSIPKFSTEELIEHHLKTVGARPVDRSYHDNRIISQVKEEEGEIIDTQDDVGGYPELPSTKRELDVPTDLSAIAWWLYRHTQAVELPNV